MYRQVIKESRPFGSVEARVVSVECNGFVAVVQSIETVGSGTELKTVKKKNVPVPKVNLVTAHHCNLCAFECASDALQGLAVLSTMLTILLLLPLQHLNK